jgi:predicted CoA-binding protein
MCKTRLVSGPPLQARRCRASLNGGRERHFTSRHRRFVPANGERGLGVAMPQNVGYVASMNEAWRENLIESEDGIRAVLRTTKTVAVLGMKTEAQSSQPAFYVPAYLIKAGLEVHPVLVYYPEATEVLGRKVYRQVADVPRPIDMVNIFRRASDVDAHVADIVAAAPRFVWMQSGIRNDRAAEELARAGIGVVQDHCLMVEHRRLA